MNRRRIAFGAGSILSAIVFAACSLNPQPLPPDTNDGGFDASSSKGDATTFQGDAGAGNDAGPVPEGDAATDGASIDASDAGDAGDASEDAPSDAYDDASD